MGEQRARAEAYKIAPRYQLYFSSLYSLTHDDDGDGRFIAASDSLARYDDLPIPMPPKMLAGVLETAPLVVAAAVVAVAAARAVTEVLFTTLVGSCRLNQRSIE
jgi:hypothetical protein